MTISHVMADGSVFVLRESDDQPITQTFEQRNPIVAATIEEQQERERLLTAKQGNFAWSKLHSYIGCDPQWLELWVYFIPNRCECKNGYQQIIADIPPDFSSGDAFFAWGVNIHNAVNQKFGKETISLDQAKSLWNRS